MHRRHFVNALPALVGTTLFSHAAGAQEAYPSRSIRFVVPFPPGGASDASARLLAQRIGARVGQSIVVVNVPGAAGNVGTEQVKAAAPDGYTWLLGFDGTLVINPNLMPKIPFDAVRDFAPVAKIGDVDLAIVANREQNIGSVADLVALSKKRPGGLFYGTTGAGSTANIAGEVLKQAASARLTHVPYKGAAPAMLDVISGQIPLAIVAVAAVTAQVKAGTVTAVAVTGARRSKSLPDVPTVQESGIAGFDISSWFGLLVPARTPAPIVATLNAELNFQLRLPEVQNRLAELGMTEVGGTPERLADQIQRDLARYAVIVKAANIQAE